MPCEASVTTETANGGFNSLLGLELKGFQGDDYCIELMLGPQHLHEANGVHGGVYLSLLDTAMARASRAGSLPGSYTPTLELKTNFLRAKSSGRILAKARVISRTRRTFYVEGELMDETGLLLARASATMMLVAPREPTLVQGA